MAQKDGEIIDKKTKTYELFRRVFRKESVQEKIHQIREKVGIPSEGFIGLDERWEFEKKLSKDSKLYITESVIDIIQKEKLLMNAYSLMYDMVFCGLFDGGYMVSRGLKESVCAIGEEGEILKKSNVPTVELVISDYASQNDIKDYITKNYSILIKGELNRQRGGGKKPKITKSGTRYVNDMVVVFSSFDIEHLKSMVRNFDTNPIDYKEQAISRLIGKLTDGDIILSRDQVLGVLRREKNKRNDKK